MTVAELIEKLRTMPPDALVWYAGHERHISRDVTEVKSRRARIRHPWGVEDTRIVKLS